MKKVIYTGLATSDYVRKIVNKMGMEMLASKKWTDCYFGGKQLYKDVKSEMVTTHFIKIKYDWKSFLLEYDFLEMLQIKQSKKCVKSIHLNSYSSLSDNCADGINVQAGKYPKFINCAGWNKCVGYSEISL